VRIAPGSEPVREPEEVFLVDRVQHRDCCPLDMPRKGDILITARGTIGVGCVVKEGDKFYYKDGNIISFREKTPTNPFFILYAFRSKSLG
jgi:type I restriction enzyme S subunit